MAMYQDKDSCDTHGDDSMWYMYNIEQWQCDFCWDNFWEAQGVDRRWTDKHEIDRGEITCPTITTTN